MGFFMPRIRILIELISYFVPDSLLEEIGTDFLEVAWMGDDVPSKEEHPGPPLSHRVRGMSAYVLDD